ncbi:hypothetical protein V5799_018675 [Amblyomma americanum]|uniref:Secreted protein n=1 Tax=Amblyomma americanum TaxID=6943 RepID=A0AAQ4EZU4_AMBAM
MVAACLLLQLLQNLSCAQLCLLRAVQVMGAAVEEVPAQAVAAFLVALHVGCAAMFAAGTMVAKRHRLLGGSASLVAGTLFIFRPLEYLGFSRQPQKTRPRSICTVNLAHQYAFREQCKHQVIIDQSA